MDMERTNTDNTELEKTESKNFIEQIIARYSLISSADKSQT